jgi:tetratricopeptide (TPR) repeat protein
MFIENWRLFSPYESILGPSSVSESKHFSVFPLTTTELRALLDRLIELETSGRVKEVRCHLSKETRFALCSEDRDRLVAAALLMFRYGRRIADILTEEFNAIDDAALRYAYLSIVVCSGVGLSLPKTIIRKMQKDQGLPQRGDFWKRLAELTSEEDGAISLRHPRFYQHIAPTVIPNPDDRGDLLTDAILHADHDENDELNFVLDVFGHRKQITYLLRRDKSAIERWKSNTKRQLRLMPTIWRRDGYVCLGQLERDSLHDSDSAAEFFEAAISCDPTFRFAYRQRSWNLLRAGRLKDAQQSANQAVDLFPGDAKTLVDSACVLQYCSQEGFRRAGQLFATALTIESGDTDLRHELLRRLDRYREAEAVFKYYILTDDDLPDQILEELKAPWYLWRVRKGIQRALKGELGSLLRYADVDADKVEDVVLSVGKGRDEVLDALVKANTARLEYQQWYHGGKQIDLVAVEKLFVKALERLEARHGESEPFVRTWYGTFLKEVKQDYAAAERQYRLAIKHADQIPGPKKDYPIRNEPMLLNNLALLLMHAARTGKNRASVFKEAEILLNTATGEVTKRQSNFLWPFDTAEELRLLRAEAR